MNAQTVSDVVTLSGLTRFFPLLNGTMLAGLIALVVKYRIENRKLSITENSGLRAEFIAEMRELRDEVKGLRTENGQLREEVRQLHAVIDGLRRQGQGDQISAQRIVMEAMPRGSIPDNIMDAARRADEAINKKR